MKRRRFIKAIAAAPAVPALLAQQPPAAALPATPVPPLAPGRGAGRGGPGRGGAQEVAHIELTELDAVAETTPKFFTPTQFAALRKLSAILLPPLKGSPGALDTDAPEFLDFLIGVSPADRQLLYRTGLDYLNAQSRKQFGKTFADIDETQADTILKPLFVPVAWSYDPPKDPIKHFIYEAHQDIRTATRNAPSATAASAQAGARRGFGGGQYWNPIDPV
jgi:Gluconate 2-dehydrogenase subunit 3